MTEADLRLTIEGEVLDLLSQHGGEVLVAGPPMEDLTRQLAGLVLRWAARGVRAGPGRGSVPPVIGADLARELAGHAGQWVAIDGQEIIAAGRDIQDLAGAAAGRGDPVIFRVPSPQQALTWMLTWIRTACPPGGAPRHSCEHQASNFTPCPTCGL
jgi:hypothetical protein